MIKNSLTKKFKKILVVGETIVVRTWVNPPPPPPPPVRFSPVGLDTTYGTNYVNYNSLDFGTGNVGFQFPPNTIIYNLPPGYVGYLTF